MQLYPLKIVTVVGEAVIMEDIAERGIELGATGYTMSEVIGHGSRSARNVGSTSGGAKTLKVEFVDEMGPVNLVAIEEYEEAEQRFNFLQAQYDDLVKAKAELVVVINRINTETKSMFVETFEKIRANFQAMFTEMFGGGKADLKLTESEDVLEAGIDIMARPPGKQLQSISLLSGGEQTMTAVALLFAIYQVKPSPFCVLDELDAPLDESNINRFTAVLKRVLDHSQFVVITHNKRTIGMADVLYGVTMQERGVSKIVSVRFNKEEGAPERATEPANIADAVRTARPAEGELALAK